MWRGVVANPFTGQRCPSQTLGGDWRCKCLPVVAQIDSDIVSGRCSGICVDYEEDVDVGVLATSRVALAILAGSTDAATVSTCTSFAEQLNALVGQVTLVMFLAL